MGIKASLSKPFASYVIKQLKKLHRDPVAAQEATRQFLVEKARQTTFGKDYQFDNIHGYNDFKQAIPLKDYEGLKPYIDKVVAGEANILWPGKPVYLCKTSGTTSGVKYIPITNTSIKTHIKAARNAILCYIAETGNVGFVNGKMIFLQGSPELDNSGAIPTGRLSGIVAHHVPGYLQKNRLPSFETNCIEDWEQKVSAIANETLKENMTLISGIPPWVQMYFEVLQEKSGKATVQEVFPNFSLFIHGGVNFEPYREVFDRMIGKKIDSIETYPASEGFIAYQDRQKEEGLLLNLEAEMFYEFIPLDEFHDENPTRISVADVVLNKNYVLILNSSAGLWGYIIGDTVKFVSLNPLRLIVTGRIKHFISAFGEHVIAEEVEKSLQHGKSASACEVTEFHVAPEVHPAEGGIAYHEWFIEFKQMPENMEAFAQATDMELQRLNSYYKDLRDGAMLDQLHITPLKEGAFIRYMESKGKLGGQNKVPRLGNDRKIADELSGEAIKIN